MTKSSRPGGRSSRVKNAVFEAVERLMAENAGAVPSMGAVAERAGVNPTSLYRRWKDADLLALEVAVDRLMRDFPVPDTGTLRGDLVGWAGAAARSMSAKKNLALLRVLAATAQTAGDASQRARVSAIGRRGEELMVMLERARARGEAAPQLSDVLEIVLAPIYLRILFFGRMRDSDDVERLVDRAIALTNPRHRAKAVRATKIRRRLLTNLR